MKISWVPGSILAFGIAIIDNQYLMRQKKCPEKSLQDPRMKHEDLQKCKRRFFWVRSCLYVKSDSLHSCTETFSIFQEILRAKSDAGALM
jgi:hypothetical protein